MNVADAMTIEVHTLSPEMPVKEAARRMVELGVSGMPVVGTDGELVGILTEADFIAPHRSLDRSRRLLRLLIGEEVEALIEAEYVAELMVDDVITIAPDEQLARAGRLMAGKGIKRLPVVDPNGRLVGIISRADLVRAFARSDEELGDDVGILIETLSGPIDLDKVGFALDNGVVTLAGEVETDAEADLLARMIRKLEGVVAVVNELTWTVDTASGPSRWSSYAQEGANG